MEGTIRWSECPCAHTLDSVHQGCGLDASSYWLRFPRNWPETPWRQVSGARGWEGFGIRALLWGVLRAVEEMSSGGGGAMLYGTRLGPGLQVEGAAGGIKSLWAQSLEAQRMSSCNVPGVSKTLDALGKGWGPGRDEI